MASGSGNVNSSASAPRRTLNEVETTVRKAALGAGLGEGLAEDTARATAWLAAHGLPSVETALEALGQDAAEAARQGARVVRDGSVARFPQAAVAVAGPSALDLLAAGPDGTEAFLEAPDAPLLVLGLAGAAAIPIVIDGDGQPLARIGPGGAWASEGVREQRPSVVRLAGPIPTGAEQEGLVPLRPSDASVAIAVDAWAALSALAARRLVPATDASRRHGAGAGERDTD